jgi:hypothetical protein
MTRVRRALGPIAALWLCGQAATLTLVPAALWGGSTDASLAACLCIRGADAACPMHHPTAAGSKVCAMGSLDTAAAAAVNSMFGGVGLMPAGRVAIAPTTTASPAFLDGSTPTGRPAPPEPPPPRA